MSICGDLSRNIFLNLTFYMVYKTRHKLVLLTIQGTLNCTEQTLRERKLLPEPLTIGRKELCCALKLHARDNSALDYSIVCRMCTI